MNFEWNLFEFTTKDCSLLAKVKGMFCFFFFFLILVFVLTVC